jgi:hypothetical protein
MSTGHLLIALGAALAMSERDERAKQAEEACAAEHGRGGWCGEVLGTEHGFPFDGTWWDFTAIHAWHCPARIDQRDLMRSEER